MDRAIRKRFREILERVTDASRKQRGRIDREFGEMLACRYVILPRVNMVNLEAVLDHLLDAHRVPGPRYCPLKSVENRRRAAEMAGRLRQEARRRRTVTVAARRLRRALSADVVRRICRPLLRR